ncbi:hypothetical protein C8R43DRAFT_910601 [Mycena crocata]|nr:hypothetical protein C8R43DRAFT_910722 [Mycena crocata]KAJ7076810.1 hypothetical protein C8R43DRAFT_910601 [Mycena crocata]
MREPELPCVEVPLQRILQGKNAGFGTESRGNLDHINPARAASVNLQLLRKHIPGAKATTTMGLSNLLAWMLTGQGFSTSGFLEDHSFFFESLKDCVSHFEDAQNLNAVVVAKYLALHPNTPLAQLKKLPGYIPIDDPNVWGQAANDLCLNPTIRYSGGKSMSITAKFAPCYEEVVSSRWRKWLGPLADTDPGKYTGSRHSWFDALDFIQSFGVNGVKGNGLTTLQLANNMVFLGICVEPTAAEMGAWIADNSTLGAFKGLILLGFNLHAADLIATRVAFQVFYDHLDRFMSAEDKALLGFGAIFVEHLLCKVQRWEERYFEGMRQSLKDFANGLPDSAWVFGDNLTNQKAFPFPLGIEPQRLAIIIQEIMVRVLAKFSGLCSTSTSARN